MRRKGINKNLQILRLKQKEKALKYELELRAAEIDKCLEKISAMNDTLVDIFEFLKNKE